MLTIKNIEKLKGIRFEDRVCSSVEETTIPSISFKERYVFVFPKVNNGYKWDQKIDIHLSRQPNDDGLYPLFVMGIKSETTILLSKDELNNKAIVLNKIMEVCRLGKKWYENSNL